MKKIEFKSIRTRLTVWFLFLALMPLLVGIIITFSQQINSIERQTFSKLTSIRDLKVRELRNWIEERIGDLKTTSTDNGLVALQDIIFKDRKGQGDLKTYKNIRRILNRYLNNYDAYNEIFIINPRTGVIEISTDIHSEGMNKSDNSYFTQPLQTHGLFIKDIYYSKTLSQNSMSFSIPIFCTKHKSEHIVAILVARVDLKNSLYALLQNRTGLGETGETLIVNKDVIALNELRSYENAPLRYKVDGLPAIRAARGETGIAQTTDYSGEKILAAYTYIPQTGWGFVAKQDLYELNTPIRALIKNFVIILSISTILILLIVFLLGKQISKPVIDMNIVAQKLRDGDYSVRNIVRSGDELGSLADSMNQTSEAFESVITTQKGVSNISETMIGLSSMQAFGSELLHRLMEITKSNMGTFYILNEAISEYEHFASVGANEELLKSFSSENPEGEFGYAISRKEIFYLRNIPEDTVFKFQTTAGDLIPKEIITIPILIDDTVAALISLVNINKFSKETHEIIKQAWRGINTSYSNLMASERTRILAENLQETNQQLEAQTEELQAQSEELQSQSEELRQTADELQEQNLELDVQKRQVEEANRLKSEFLSNMSHELRTPLNSVMALSRVLLMQVKDKLSEEETGYLEIIERNGKNLLALINDILDLSKIEAGRMDVDPKLFPVNLTIETILERIEPLAENKGIEIIKKIPDDLPRIESDENRVHQILQNLIGNAVKFTKQGSVTVSARSNVEEIQIEVSDTGIGISRKDQPHIFEEFRQVDGTSARSYEGTGLGLAIAYRAARMLGGGISMESTLGKGSTFTLTLPVRWQGTALLSEPAMFRPSGKIEQMKKTILVVDDDTDARAMISDYLSQEGYNTITAASGKEAIGLAETHHPFVITLDILMPDMDGWEVLQHLKQNSDTKKIPVIIVSISDDKSTGIALGAVGYISKPVNRDLLIAEINRIGGPSVYTVVVADDNEIELREMAHTIEQEGMQAISAENGSICIDILKETVPDVLVLDLIMPEMDGFEVLDKVRSAPETRDLPVIVVTAKDLTVEEKQKLSGNVSSILAKSDTTSTVLLEEIKKTLVGLEKVKKDAGIGKRKALDRLLLVEDNEAAVIQVKAVLEDEGYIVDVARGGREALDYMSRIIPGGIILDLMMPDIDGFQVLAKMRGTEATARVPVLILTARDLTPEDFGKLSANNVRQLVQKGDVDRQSLLFKIRLMLGESSRPETGGMKLETGNLKPETRKLDTGHRATILVVEDNPDNMITIKAVFGNRYNILEAMDGETGLHMALTLQPDLILLDMSLPKMDGFTVAGRVKQDKKAGHIPIIALTASAMKGDREKVMDAGCDDYISKPVDPEKVLAKIEKWVGA